MGFLIMLLIIPFNTTVPYDQLPDTINVVVVDLNGTIHDRMNYTTNQFDSIGNYSMIYQLPIDKETPDAFHIDYGGDDAIVYTLFEESDEPFTVIPIDEQPDFSDIMSSKISLLIILGAVMIASIGLVIKRRDNTKQKEDDKN